MKLGRSGRRSTKRLTAGVPWRGATSSEAMRVHMWPWQPSAETVRGHTSQANVYSAGKEAR